MTDELSMSMFANRDDHLRALLRSARVAAFIECEKIISSAMCDVAEDEGLFMQIRDHFSVLISYALASGRYTMPPLVELVNALRPFAEAADSLEENHQNSGSIWETGAAMSLTAHDLRNARAILDKIEAVK